MNNNHKSSCSRLFFIIIKQPYIFKCISFHLHYNHNKYKCVKKLNNIEYSDYLVENNIIDRINHDDLLHTVRYWSIKSLKYLLSKQDIYFNLIESLIIKDKEQLLHDQKQHKQQSFILPINDKVINKAIKHAPISNNNDENQFKLVKILMSNYSNCISNQCYKAAAKYGRIDIIRFMIKQFPHVKIGSAAATAASRSNQLDTLIFFDYLDKCQKKLVTPTTDFELIQLVNGLGFDSSVFSGAIIKGNVECLSFLIENRPEGCIPGAIEIAIRSVNFGERHFEAIKMARGKLYMVCSEQAIVAASETGNLEVLRYLQKEGVLTRQNTNNTNALTSAARAGHLEVIKYLIETVKCDPDRYTGIAVAKYGHLHIMEYLLAKQNKKIFHGVLDYSLYDMVSHAFGRGHLEIVKLLMDKKHNVKKLKDMIVSYRQFMEPAISSGNLKLLEYLLTTHRRMFPYSFVNGVAIFEMNSKLSEAYIEDVVILLHSYDINFEISAQMDHRDMQLVTQFSLRLFQHFESCHSLSKHFDYFQIPASKGKLDIIKYLIDSGYSNHGLASAVYKAVSGNHLDVVKYLLDFTKIDPDSRIIDSAISSGSIDMVRYVFDQFPKHEPSINSFMIAANGPVEVFELLSDRYKDYLLSDTITISKEMARRPDIISCICSGKCPPDLFILSTETMKSIILENLYDTLLILLTKYKPTISFDLLCSANSLEILILLIGHCDNYIFEMNEKLIHKSKDKYQIYKYLMQINNNSII